MRTNRRVQSTSAGTQEEAKTGHSPRSAAGASAIRGKTAPRRTREPARVWLRWVADALSGGARKGGSTRLSVCREDERDDGEVERERERERDGKREVRERGEAEDTSARGREKDGVGGTDE